MTEDDENAWSVYRGTVVEAEYSDTHIPAFDGNPHIESLGPVPTLLEIAQHLAVYPPFDPSHRMLPDELRIEALCTTIAEFFQPTSLHLDLARRLHGIVRRGYQRRNPVDAKHLFKISRGIDQLEAGKRLWRAQRLNGLANGMSILGISGAGKTSGLQGIVSILPQVAHHAIYRGHRLMHAQVPWLLLDCPHDGSIKALCHRFFRAFDQILGTRYHERCTRGDPAAHKLTPALANIAAIHGLGVLIIDELQHLSPVRSQGHPNMLNFFVDLSNTLRIPVVRVGTYKATKLLHGEFRQARRGLATGDFEWDRMKPHAQGQDSMLGAWETFWRPLWRYQYTRQQATWSDHFSDVLYAHTQGVTDLCLKLFAMAQIRAIEHGEEIITPGRIETVARRDFKTVQSALAALRSNEPSRLAEWEDLQPPRLSLRDQVELQMIRSKGHVTARTDANAAPNEDEEIRSALDGLADAAPRAVRSSRLQPAQEQQLPPQEPATAADVGAELRTRAVLPLFATPQA